MKLLGWELTATKTKSLQAVYDSGRSWWPIIRESFAGAWQQNVTIDRDTVVSHSAVYACVSLISQDIGKMRVKLVEQQASTIWKEVESPAFSPVLRKPNHFQTRVKFFEYWITSKLVHGNTYALKRRDNRGVVVALYLLDPTRVIPMVSDDGSVFYQLRKDNLSGQDAEVLVPAREVIHDTAICLFHPLIGVSPIFACGLAAVQGIRIQSNSTRFFENFSKPGGVLTAPGAISDETAARLKIAWEENYSGANAGRTAILGDGLHYEATSFNAVDSQLIEQLKWTAENVCSCFHVPPYMIGVGPMPAYNNIEALNQQYYSQCLQSLIESLELCLDEGLDLPGDFGTEFDLEGLLRMDTATRFKSHSDAIGGGWMSPNEARIKEDLEPVTGGDSPMIQQQNFSLQALAKRDAQADPFGTEKPAPPALPAPDKPVDDGEDQARAILDIFIKGLTEAPMFDGKALGEQLLVAVKDYMARASSVVYDRIRAIENQIAEIPAGPPGEQGAPGVGIPGEKGEPGESIKGDPGQDGKSVTADEVIPALQAELKKAIESLPVPQDGKDGADGKGVTVEDFRPLFEAEQAKWALEFERRAQDQLQRSIDRAPKAVDGKDGLNGLGFDDLEVIHDGERGFTFRFTQGEQVKEFPFKIPALIERGIYRAGQAYEKGDGVTYGGSYWIAQKDTSAKPGESDDFRLAVKKGRDGKDGLKGDAGVPGLKGRDGRDLTQILPDGSRY